MTYYKCLEVNENATQDEIKKAYRRLSLQHHPDKNKGDDVKFKEINEAYQILGDVNKRKEYDMKISGRNMPFGGSGMPFGGGMQFRGGMPFQGGMPDEILRAMFGGGNGMPNIRIFRNGVEQPLNNQLKKPVPIIKTVEITLEQSYNGVKIPFALERWVIEGNLKKTEKETIYIDIPKGTDNNEIIIIRNKGNIISDTNKGDIKVFIKVKNDTQFKRDGLNLILNKNISLKDSLCGFDFVINYFNNRNFIIKNYDNIITPGFSKVVPNLGLKREGHTGNLIITFNVKFPEKIDADKIEKLKELL